MAALGEHPRLARMALMSAQLGCEPLGCMLAALISEGDFLRGAWPLSNVVSTADVAPRLRLLLNPGNSPEQIQAALAPVLKATERLLQSLGAERSSAEETVIAGSVQTVTVAGAAAGPGISDAQGHVEPDQGRSTAPPDQADEAVLPDQAPGAALPDQVTDPNLSNQATEAVPPDQAPGMVLPDKAIETVPDQAPGTAVPKRQQAAARDKEVETFRASVEAELEGCLPGVLIAVAYPERIAQRQSRSNRDRPGYMMASGTSVRLPSAGDPLGGEDLLAVAAAGGLRGGGRNDSISLAAPLDAAALEKTAPQLLRSRTHVFWAPGAKAVVGRRQRCIGELILEEDPAEVTDEQALPILIQALCGSGSSPLCALKLPEQVLAFRQRVIWLRSYSARHLLTAEQERLSHTSAAEKSSEPVADPSRARGENYAEQGSEPDLEEKLQAAAALPDLSDGTLVAVIGSWLQPYLKGMRNLAQVQSLDWHAIFRSLLNEEQHSLLQELAPELMQLSDGRNAAIDYSCDPPSITAAQMSGGGRLEESNHHSICQGLVILQVQQALRSPELASSRQTAGKTPKGKKKRGKK